MTDVPVPAQPEVRVRRLIITDSEDAPRIVGEVIGDAAELRVGLDRAHPDAHVLLYAVQARSHLVGPQLGVQLWADGNSYAEINLIRQDERWTAHVHLPRDGRTPPPTSGSTLE